MVNTFDWVEIRIRDMKETRNFYENLFGWSLVRQESAEGFDYWIFDTGEEPRIQNIQRVGIWARPDNKEIGIVVYIVVEDIDTILRKVTELGGDVAASKTSKGSAFKAYFRDPDGNLLGLWEEEDAD